MDEKDKKILNALKEDSSATTREIAKKTLVPITTVHKRRQKLKQLGVIKKYTVDIDYSKLDKGLGAVILVSIDSRLLREHKMSPKELGKKLSFLPYVEKTFHVTGLADIVLVVRVKDTTELEEVLYDMKKKYESIERTQTMIVMSES